MDEEEVEHAKSITGFEYCGGCGKAWPCEVARLRAENERLRARLRIVTEECRIATAVLTDISHCGCSACGPSPRDLKHAQVLAQDALIRMSVVE